MTNVVAPCRMFLGELCGSSQRTLRFKLDRGDADRVRGARREAVEQNGKPRRGSSYPHGLAQHDQLPQMIGVVVGKEQSFAQECLSISPWKFCA